MSRPSRGAGLLVVLAALLAAPPPAAGASPQTEAADWLTGYLRLDTSNPPGHEERAAGYLAGILRRAGLEPRLLVSPAGRTSLWARLRAGSGDGPAVVLLHHLDVVPAGPGWTQPPFAGVVADGDLYGRGAVDAKSLGIAHLAALIDLARHPAARRRDVIFLAVADEEAGGGEGTGWLLAAHPELFTGVEVVLVEGGYNKTVLGRTLWWGIEVAQKRPLWLEVVARGRPGHASQLNPQSAAHQLILGLARLVSTPRRPRLDPVVQRLLAAQVRFEPDLAALAAAPAGPLAPDIASALPPRLLTYLVDSLQVTTLAAAEQVNVVAAEARARIDARLLPGTDQDEMLAALRTAVGRELEVRVLLEAPEAAASPTDSPFFRTLATSLGDDSPVIPIFIPGVTDARYFRARGIAAYGLSPFRLEVETGRGIHGPDERIPLAELARGVERMSAVLRALVAPAP